MWRTVGGLVTLASVLVVAAGVQPSAQPPARDTPPPRVGTGRIRGSVIAADTAQPLRQAQVRLMSPEIRESSVSRRPTARGDSSSPTCPRGATT